MDAKVTEAMVLQQPWARLVVEGVLPVLVRPKATRIRERVAILATGVDPLTLVDSCPANSKEFPQPAIIGSVRIADCVEVSHEAINSALTQLCGKDYARFYPKHFLPETPPAYLWFIVGPKMLKRPRPFKEIGCSRMWRRL